MITLTDIAYVRSGAADLDKAVQFATEIVGLELASTDEPGVAHLRADHRHHCLALVEGTSGVIASGFTVADEDALTDAETYLEKQGFTVTRGTPAEARSRRVRSFIGFDDPFGTAWNWSPSRNPSAARCSSTAPPGSRSSGTCASTPPTCTRPTGSGPPTSTPRSPTGSATAPA